MATESLDEMQAKIADNPFVDVSLGDKIKVTWRGMYRGDEYSEVMTVADAGNHVPHRHNWKAGNALDAVTDSFPRVTYRFHPPGKIGNACMYSIKTSSRRHDRLVSNDFEIEVLQE